MVNGRRASARYPWPSACLCGRQAGEFRAAWRWVAKSARWVSVTASQSRRRCSQATAARAAQSSWGRLRGQSGRRTFGPEGGIGPAQSAPDPVALGTANRPVFVRHHLDPALGDLVQGEPSRSSAMTRDGASAPSAGLTLVKLAWAEDATDRRVHEPGQAAAEGSAIRSAPQQRLDYHPALSALMPHREVRIRRQPGRKSPSGTTSRSSSHWRLASRVRFFPRFSTSAATSNPGPGGGVSGLAGPAWRGRPGAAWPPAGGLRRRCRQPRRPRGRAAWTARAGGPAVWRRPLPLGIDGHRPGRKPAPDPARGPERLLPPLRRAGPPGSPGRSRA